jgi:hypothetical protein
MNSPVFLYASDFPLSHTDLGFHNIGAITDQPKLSQQLSWVLLEKLRVTQRVTKYAAMYVVRCRVHKSRSLVPNLKRLNPVHSISPHFSCDRASVFSLHMHTGLSRGLTLSGFPVYNFSLVISKLQISIRNS